MKAELYTFNFFVHNIKVVVVVVVSAAVPTAVAVSAATTVSAVTTVSAAAMVATAATTAVAAVTVVAAAAAVAAATAAVLVTHYICENMSSLFSHWLCDPHLFLSMPSSLRDLAFYFVSDSDPRWKAFGIRSWLFFSIIILD
jgi:hypothetical protein